MRRTFWQYTVIRLTEAGTWRGIQIGLGLTGLKTTDPWWSNFFMFGMIAATFVQGYLAEFSSGVTVDQKQLDDALKSAPVSTAPSGGTTPVHIGDTHV